ncbi:MULTISPECIES: biotin-dependent carboxyltransferase family protein [unclassified Curtobacterium]|uniref:5-oxoprolinase subunit C family protein n=1 Tax=unclassified Curtobacterium TaxID=257496 RepID=UPI0008DD0C4D|nr:MULTISPECIES: biotin-dependent carboxyltransferase family protein [unclassified Curtobacterium]OIH94240.1 allophanate hydrolase [Curtobacterium sp. MCBA15_003]OII29264.1 allophanate hydrolase [Curtobacterium sp. MMLR14_006]
MSALTVTHVGYGVTTQDLGRPGFSDMGLGAAGAADRGSAALANRLVGNRPDAAVLEALLGSVALRADAYVVAATTGAACPVEVERADGGVRGAASHEVLLLAPGDTLRIGTATVGLRAYVAVLGGVAVDPVLGSRSWDSLARLGPPPLAVGDVLPVGDARVSWPNVDAVPQPPEDLPGGHVLLDVVPGPRADWFTAGWRRTLTGQDHHVTPDSDRVGVRTTADRPLERAVTGELPSEGVETGSLQVPPEGHPVLFLADHPVTGGYPVVAVLTPTAVDRAAQLRPGDRLRFRVVE